MIAKRKNDYSLMMLILGIVLGAFVLIHLFMLFFAVMSALNTTKNFDRYPMQFFKAFELKNFIDAFSVLKVKLPDGSRTVYSLELYFNTIVYALTVAFTTTIVPCITAYMCAKYRNKFSLLVETIVIVVMIVPIVGNLPAQLLFADRLGIKDSFIGINVMSATFTGMYFLVFHATFRDAPDAYAEAAEIDGAGQFSVLVRIYLPLVKNIFFTIMLLKFIESWNNYQTPVLFLPNKPTISYSLYYISQYSDSGFAANYPLQLASAILVSLPMVIVFTVFHKRLLGNLSVGGLKG